jgi:DNA-binding transcriptional regulator LsrR (DeoR family)
MTDEELNQMNKLIRKRYKHGWTVQDIAEYMAVLPEEVRMAIEGKQNET